MPEIERTGATERTRTFVFKRDLPVFLLFLLLAVIFLLPGSLHLRTALLGYPGDTFQHAWFLWHFARAVSHGQNPFYTNLIFYPNHVNLAWSTTDPLASFLALPFSLTAGPVVAYNASLILQLALGAFFAYLLCLRICGNVAAAIIGGVSFGFSPFLMGEALGHLSLVTAFPIPLYFLTLDTLLQPAFSTWKSGVATGLALFLTSLAHYNYTVFCILLTIVIVGVDFALKGRALAERIWKSLATAGATFGLLFLPFFISMWSNADARPASRSFDLIEGHSADALGWLVPSWNHLLLGRFSRNWNSGLFTAGYEGTVYLGPVILILAAVGFSVGRRTNRRWAIRLLVASLIFWALSLGPRVRIWGFQTKIPGPALLLYMSRFARFVSAPARFHVIAMLCLAGLASMGVASILQNRRLGRGRTAAVVVAICVLLALDLLTLPFPLATSAASAQYRGFGIPTDGCSLPADADGTTVVTVPELQWPYPVRAMWIQIADGGHYALADGYVSYGPNSIWEKFWSVPILRSLRALQEGNSAEMGIDAARASAPTAVHELNLGAFVVFDFPQRDVVVNYLHQVLNREGQRQASCTVFDLRDAAEGSHLP